MKANNSFRSSCRPRRWCLLSFPFIDYAIRRNLWPLVELHRHAAGLLVKQLEELRGWDEQVPVGTYAAAARRLRALIQQEAA